MMRACHLNTCPVGIATQDPELRKRFAGTPEHVVNFFFFVAEEARRDHGAGSASRRFEDLIGRADLLEADDAIDHWKARGVDLSHLLAMPDVPAGAPLRRMQPQDSPLPRRARLGADRGAPAGDRGRQAGRRRVRRSATSTARVGGLLSSAITSATAPRACRRRRSASRCAARPASASARWLAPGVELTLCGDANDYTGKGLSGGVLAVRPPEGATFAAEENVIVGNTVLYGATAGPRVLPRPRGRALRRAQLGRRRRRRGRRRPRLRVHDRRPRRRARPHRAATSRPA